MPPHDHDSRTIDPVAGKVGESEAERQGKQRAADQLEADGETSGLGSGRGPESALDRAPRWQPRYPGSGRLAGKVALVTGGDSGIGRAVAALFAREGADVAIFYNSSDDDAHETVRIVEAEGRNAMAIKGDVGVKADCDDCITQIVEELGGVDIVINNAGEQHPAEDIADISEEQLQRTFQTNIFGMFYMVQAALPHLSAGSAIVNCTSVTMYQGAGQLLDYSATKGAITAFTRSLSESLVEKGIRVNGVAPGPIWTPLNPLGGADPDKLRSFGESTPMKRPGEPNEVAPAFLFLACEDSSYMSGQVLHPNGGTIVNG
jgi:NAD(P)-dependent dehydrogenase (short-subunit alcohol dehydrogenase family)